MQSAILNKHAALNKLDFVKISVYIIQNPLFVPAPLRGDKQPLVSVSGYAVDHHFRRYAPYAACKQAGVFLKAQSIKAAPAVVCCKVGILQHVQKLELDAVGTAAAYILCRLVYHLLSLSGKTYYHVHYHLKPGLLKAGNSIVKHGKFIAPADIFCAAFMYALKPQLYPDGLCAVNIRQKLKHFSRQAVGPCCHRQCDDFLRGDGGGVHASQLFNRGVGAGEALEIGYIFAVRGFCAHKCLGLLEGLCHILPGADGKVTAAPAGAEYAAPTAQSAVPVGACKAAVKAQFIYFAAEAVAQVFI